MNLRNRLLLFALTGLFASAGFAMGKKPSSNSLEVPPDLAELQYSGSSVDQVWSQIQSDPYQELPSNKVGYFDLFKGSVSLIKRAANRTLNSHLDLLPYFNKLAHPNGICLKGEWKITEANPYSGLFKLNTEALIIGRASVALSETEEGSLRGFGFAGKIFPTTNSSEIVKPANFFLVDDLGGTSAKHYTDVEMTNEPKASKTLAILENLAYALKLAATFTEADKNPTIRQVYEIAEAGRAVDEKLKVPHWMMFRASKGQKKINEADFRNELSVMNSENGIQFDVFVADSEKGDRKNWMKVGVVEIQESMLSESCDHRLHFHHPKWRSDLGF